MTDLTERARLAVAARAADADDCRQILAILGLLPIDPKQTSPGHGDNRRYVQGCRCAPCTAAAAEQARSWRKRVRSDPGAADRAGHGREYTYRVYGCRCTPCTEANRLRMREYRAARAAAQAAAA